MAGKAKQTVTNTRTKTRVKKDGSTNKSGYEICRLCGGSGIQRTPKKKG